MGDGDGSSVGDTAWERDADAKDHLDGSSRAPSRRNGNGRGKKEKGTVLGVRSYISFLLFRFFFFFFEGDARRSSCGTPSTGAVLGR